MLLQLQTGKVKGYTEGQVPLIYLCSGAQVVQNRGLEFVFSDGHGIAAFTQWFDDLNDLGKVDWDMVYQRLWFDDNNNPDRQRRKQAEFLVYKVCPWSVIDEIVVIDKKTKTAVETILADFSEKLSRPVQVRRDWYY